LFYAGLWGTRQTEDTQADRELYIRTTIRELVMYIFFLMTLCICKYIVEWICGVVDLQEQRRNYAWLGVRTQFEANVMPYLFTFIRIPLI